MDDKYENPPPRGYSIPTIDLDAQTAHQVVVDRVDEPDIEPWVAYLLLDRRLISSADNAVLGQGIVKKHSANPLFGEDLPWETGMSHMYAFRLCQTLEDRCERRISR